MKICFEICTNSNSYSSLIFVLILAATTVKLCHGLQGWVAKNVTWRSPEVLHRSRLELSKAMGASLIFANQTMRVERPPEGALFKNFKLKWSIRVRLKIESYQRFRGIFFLGPSSYRWARNHWTGDCISNTRRLRRSYNTGWWRWSHFRYRDGGQKFLVSYQNYRCWTGGRWWLQNKLSCKWLNFSISLIDVQTFEITLLFIY